MKGLIKLTEEAGELIQIAAKKQAFPDTDVHPDGNGSMKERLENEIADVVAACQYVVEANGLNWAVIQRRRQLKLDKFTFWKTE